MSCETAQKNEVITLACDHAGFQLKEIIKEHLEIKGYKPVDMGTDSTLRVDYPDYAKKACEAVMSGTASRGHAAALLNVPTDLLATT